jgi:hypothetical protein
LETGTKEKVMPRDLRCQNFEHVRKELDRLEKGPVTTTGSWSFYQIITHVSKGVEGSMKGVKRGMPFWKKYIFGPIAFRLFKLQGRIPRGIKGPPSDRIEGNEVEAITRYRKALDTFEEFEGPVSDHPVLGPFTKKKWLDFHSWHFANHASHAKPKE